MSKMLKLGIVISALGFGNTASAFGTVSSRVTALGQTIDKLKMQQKAALTSMDREWVYGGAAVKKYAGEVDALDKRIKALTADKMRLEQLGGQHSQNRADMNSRIGDVAAAYGIGRMVMAPVSAFVRQDDALNALQVAMMDKNGQVNESYGALRRQAVELGNILPGTTADFAGTARALMEQGVAIGSVLNGGLKSAAYLSVVLRVPADQAGEMAAKLREAYKLSDSELTKMADSMQRAKFAFGMKPSDLMAASAYQAPMLNQLGISGVRNTDKMLALQGLGAQVGLEGSSWGTNFSMMLSRLAKGPLMVAEAKKGMKAEARHIMDTMGVTFDFFDKKGNFAGLDHMVKELEKLQVIRKKLGDKAAMEVAEAMFGTEAGRPAMILAEAGSKGFAEAQKRMADQANLNDRIKKTLESTRNTWEALTGSIENFAAAVSGPAVQSLHPLINGLNSVTGSLTDFAERHPRAAKWIGVTVGAVAALTVGMLALGAGMSVMRFAWTGMQLIPGMMTLTKVASWLGGVLRGTLLIGLRVAGQAILFLGRALLLNPIGLAVTAIAGAAFLLYKYWKPITEWLGRTAKKFTSFGSALVDGLVGGITSRLSAAKSAIVGFGQNVKGWFADTLGIKSPSRVFMSFGSNISEGAQLGILSGVSGVKGAVGKLAGVALAGAVATSTGAFASVRDANQMLIESRSGAPQSAGMTIHFSPVIHVSGGGDVRAQTEQALRLSFNEFSRLMRDYEADKNRRSF